jgi:hypothetical protein
MLVLKMTAIYPPCCAAADPTVMAISGSIIATPIAIAVAAAIVGTPIAVSASVVAAPIHPPHRAPPHAPVMAVAGGDDLSI